MTHTELSTNARISMAGGGRRDLRLREVGILTWICGHKGQSNELCSDEKDTSTMEKLSGGPPLSDRADGRRCSYRARLTIIRGDDGIPK